MNVLFVCLGNICRSPMAEGIFQDIINKRGLADRIKTDSAGTASYHIGELADKRARQACKEKDIDLTHRARQFSPEDFMKFDYILVMDHENLTNVNRQKPHNAHAEVWKMRDFDPLKKGADVPDPYYGKMDGFVEVFEMLKRSCETFLAEVPLK